MTVETETLLPEPSSSREVLSSDATGTGIVDLKGTEDLLVEAAAGVSASCYPLPSSSAADLFGGELGEYELNEIPSLFNLDSQHMNMSADLESLGLPAPRAESATGSTELPFITSSSTSSVTSATQISTNTTETIEGDSKEAKKRTAAEISEDEDSQSSKTRRVTRCSGPTASKVPSVNLKPITPPAPSSSPLAPKPATKKITLGDGTGKIDTSTAHVKALTGAKGAAMCFEIVSGTEKDMTIAIPNLASTDLSPEEKAKFSRDRNRLHARNTRIRKKAYVDELKKTLDVLVKERDNAVAAKSRQVQIESEERDVRFSVLQEFLRLRGRNEQAPARWNAILEANVTLHLPNLEFRIGNSANAGASKKMVSGVPQLMEECNDFTKQINVGKRGAKRTMGTLNFQCDRPTLLMEGCSVVLDWTATSTDALKASFMMRGTCRATFNPQSNKLHSVELFFDSSPLLAKN